MQKEYLTEYWNRRGTEAKLLTCDEVDLSLPAVAVGCYAIKNNSILLKDLISIICDYIITPKSYKKQFKRDTDEE